MYYNQIHRVIYLSALIFLCTAFVFVSCQSKEEKNNGETVTEEISTENSSPELVAFKESTEKSIATNNKRIQQLKEKINKPGTPNLDKLRANRIDELENQNTKLSAKIIEYKYKQNEVQSDWEKFKADVQKELDDLSKAINELDGN